MACIISGLGSSVRIIERQKPSLSLAIPIHYYTSTLVTGPATPDADFGKISCSLIPRESIAFNKSSPSGAGTLDITSVWMPEEVAASGETGTSGSGGGVRSLDLVTLRVFISGNTLLSVMVREASPDRGINASISDICEVSVMALRELGFITPRLSLAVPVSMFGNCASCVR